MNPSTATSRCLKNNRAASQCHYLRNLDGTKFDGMLRSSARVMIDARSLDARAFVPLLCMAQAKCHGRQAQQRGKRMLVTFVPLTVDVVRQPARQGEK